MGETSHPSSDARPVNREKLSRTVFVLGVFAVCLVRLVSLVQATAVDVLFDDQWDALRPLFTNQGPGQTFFSQHGLPFLGLGGVVDWYLFAVTGWDVRAESWAGVVALVLATAFALALAVRLRGHLAWSDAAFPLLLLSGLHWETLTFTPFLGATILPLLFTVLLAYAWSSEARWGRVFWIGLLGALTLFTGYGFCGFPATVALALVLWCRPRPVPARDHRWVYGWILAVAGVAALAFVAQQRWALGEGPFRFPVANWWDYPRFVALLFTSMLGWRAITVGSVLVGAILLALVIAAWAGAARAIWRRQPSGRARAVWILTGTSLVYATLNAVGRLPTNLEAAFMWRYTTLMMPALCGLALAAEGWAKSRTPRLRLGLGVAWLALAGMIWGNFTPETYAATVAQAKRLWVASYLSSRDLHAANQASNYWVYFQNPDSPGVAEKLRWLEKRHLSFFRTTEAEPAKLPTPPPQPR